MTNRLTNRCINLVLGKLIALKLSDRRKRELLTAVDRLNDCSLAPFDKYLNRPVGEL